MARNTRDTINVRRTVAPRHAGRLPQQRIAPPKGRSGAVAAIGQDMRAAISDTLKEVMLTAADALEANSPIDTGHLVSNWILSVGRPFTGVAGSRQSVTYAAQDAGREKVLAYDVGRDGRIYISNNVPYLQYQRPFVTESLMAGAAAAPRGMKTRVRKMLKNIARSSFRKGA